MEKKLILQGPRFLCQNDTKSRLSGAKPAFGPKSRKWARESDRDPKNIGPRDPDISRLDAPMGAKAPIWLDSIVRTVASEVVLKRKYS